MSLLAPHFFKLSNLHFVNTSCINTKNSSQSLDQHLRMKSLKSLADLDDMKNEVEEEACVSIPFVLPDILLLYHHVSSCPLWPGETDSYGQGPSESCDL